MPEEYFDVAYINFDEAILHGRIRLGRDENFVAQEKQVRLTLTDEQKKQIEDLNFEHEMAMTKLLSGFAHAVEGSEA